MIHHTNLIAQAFEEAVESRHTGTRIALWVVALSGLYLAVRILPALL
jgi:ABC-type phosphate/phosphonate transport system permease subunit